MDFAASSLRAYDGVGNAVGEPKSRHFGLSQALANQVVRKGVCGDFILCGLSPPVSAGWSLVHRYTLLTTGGSTKILGSTRSRPR